MGTSDSRADEGRGTHTSARYARDPWACFGSTGSLSDATRRMAPTPASRRKVVTVLGLHGVDAAGECLRDEVDALVRAPTAGPVRPQPHPLVPGPELGVIFRPGRPQEAHHSRGEGVPSPRFPRLSWARGGSFACVWGVWGCSRLGVGRSVVATLAVGWRPFRPQWPIGLWQHVCQGNEGEAR